MDASYLDRLDEQVRELTTWCDSRIMTCREQEQKFGGVPTGKRTDDIPQSLVEAWTERRALEAVLKILAVAKAHPASWLDCPDCRALSKSGHEPPRCDVFLANERAASTACDCTPTAHGHLSSCPRYRP